MIAPGIQGITFNRLSIGLYAPAESGVYAIYNGRFWIYVGESENIQARLLEHLGDPTTCINRNQPTGFAYELVGERFRVQRQDQLILTLVPICNRRLG
jgi:hypothetical protein